jgi:hypothetical protein
MSARSYQGVPSEIGSALKQDSSLNNSFKSQETISVASVTALSSISKDDVCYAHTGINSAGACQVSLKNCERRNHDLGFGTPRI